MRVLILSHYFDPEPIPKPGELASFLASRGHDVRVVTGFPNYPTGEVFPGYHVRPWSNDRVGSNPVLRVLVFPYHGAGSLGRIFNYASFAVSASCAAFAFPRPDVIYAWHPPLTVRADADSVTARP